MCKLKVESFYSSLDQKADWKLEILHGCAHFLRQMSITFVSMRSAQAWMDFRPTMFRKDLVFTAVLLEKNKLLFIHYAILVIDRSNINTIKVLFGGIELSSSINMDDGSYCYCPDRQKYQKRKLVQNNVNNLSDISHVFSTRQFRNKQVKFNTGCCSL